MANRYPELTQWTPEEDAIVQGSRPNITLDFSSDMVVETFSDPVQLAGAVTLLEEESGQKVDLSFVEYVTASKRVVLAPAEDLQPGTVYRVLVRNKLPDTYGRKTPYELTFRFQTAGVSLGAPALQGPPLTSVQPIFPTLVWETVAGSGVTYQVQIDERFDFVTPAYDQSTSQTSVTPVGSFEPEVTHYWRVRAISGGVYGPWSKIWSFYYGSPVAADRSSRAIIEDREAFRIRRIGWDDGATMLQEHPLISLTFSSPPASDYETYVVVWEKDQLPRNDDRTTLFERRTAGTWAKTGNRLVFTPSESIKENTRYEVRVHADLQDELGREIEENYRLAWNGAYRPFYCAPRAIRARFRSAEAIPDDLLNFYIFQTSLTAKARYASYVNDLPQADALSEVQVWEGKELTSHGVGMWVQAATVYELLKSILFEELRNIDRTRVMQRFQDSLGPGFMEGIREAFKTAKEDMEAAEGLLIPTGDPISVSRIATFDPTIWSGHPIVGPELAWRGEEF